MMTHQFKPSDLKCGDRLENGAIVIDVRRNETTGRSFVLARYHEPQPWVTWMLDDDGNTEVGCYFASLSRAADSLWERASY